MKNHYAIFGIATLMGVAAPFAVADSIAPTTFSATVDVGESTTVRKTVTVSKGTPTTSKVDVYFLADTTGSMGGEIGAVKAAASSILASAAGLGDVQFAVGYYSGEIGDRSYGLYQGVTANQANVQTAINKWAACVPDCGGDGPEANLYALYHASSDAATGWRTGSEKIIIWFGDVQGHDPSPGGVTPSDGKKTETDAKNALLAKSINVQAINVGGLDGTGQATRLTAATGGTLYNGINTGSIVSTINAAIATTVSTYSTVSLDLSEVPAGVDATLVPVSHTGSFDRSVDRTFEFDLTFKGVTPGTYDFAVYGTVDGGRVATETDRIVVNDGTPRVPDNGQSAAFLALSLGALGVMRRKLNR